MKMRLRETKKNHLAYLILKLDNGIDDDSAIYIQNCKNLLEAELLDKQIPQLRFDKIVLEKLKIIGFNSEESLVLAYLFSNQTITAGELLKLTKIERGKIYRILKKLQNMGIVDNAGIGVCNFYILDKAKPFKNIIQKKQGEIQELMDFKGAYP